MFSMKIIKNNIHTSYKVQNKYKIRFIRNHLEKLKEKLIILKLSFRWFEMVFVMGFVSPLVDVKVIVINFMYSLLDV